MLYSPRLRDDQIRALYQLKLQRKRPMTKLVQEAVDHYLKRARDRETHVPVSDPPGPQPLRTRPKTNRKEGH